MRSETIFPNDFFGLVAKHALGSRVEGLNEPFLINDDEAVGCCLYDGFE